ncbi:signal peptidase II [Candidatus Pantoea edessiphila]|uniref:Lipoprotein signal peptidase n=1 Tax=Candidatus Pantoea edessiphila TaxID=2044610 RepID=A0A2P5T064_9GAMM|nr:signal peptidase II [Candidatus Pantoea edessiphila]PPI87956.1 signal peptidase II [Candidatus Pantoea edessiphila]
MNKPIKLTNLLWLWLVLIVIIIDIYSKKEIMHNMCLYETRQLTSFLNMFYCHNYGIAFSFLADGKNWQRLLFISISIIVSIFLLISISYNNSNSMISVAYALIMGGALSNSIDRFYNGFIVDFIDLHVKNLHFATFNIADCSIFIGVILLMIKNFNYQ